MNSMSNIQNPYGIQMSPDMSAGTPSIKLEEKEESNIGAWLAGGAAVIVGVVGSVAAAKKGKNVCGDNGVIENITNGVKAWFGKNGKKAINALDDIPSECRTPLKTLYSGGKISATQSQEIIDHKDNIAEVFRAKARSNAEKQNKLAAFSRLTDDTKKANFLDNFFGVKGLKIDSTGLNIKDLSIEDQARVARKLKKDGESIDSSNINNMIDGLKDKYQTKQANYNTKAANIQKLELNDLVSPKTDNLIAKRFSRYNTNINNQINSKDDYINAIKSYEKWYKAGDLTTDEYDNLVALAESKFQGGNDYLTYMLNGLTNKDGQALKATALTSDDIKTIQGRYNWLDLKVPEGGTSVCLTKDAFLTQRKNSAQSIASYLGLQGKDLTTAGEGWTFNGDKFIADVSSTTNSDGTITQNIPKFYGNNIANPSLINGNKYTLTLNDIKKIFAPPSAPSSPASA